MLLSCFELSAQASPEHEFWTWFQKNDSELFNHDSSREETFDRLAIELKKINPSLTFEFGPIEKDRREFVISADGIIEAFPAVERLYESAPKLKHWIWVKFRPRGVPMDVEYSGVSVKAKDVFFAIKPNRPKAGLTVFIRGYQVANEIAIKGIVYLMLDQALGEFDVETKVGVIEVKDYSEGDEQKKRPLVDLPKTFDDFVASQDKEPTEARD